MLHHKKYVTWGQIVCMYIKIGIYPWKTKKYVVTKNYLGLVIFLNNISVKL